MGRRETFHVGKAEEKDGDRPFLCFGSNYNLAILRNNKKRTGNLQSFIF